MEKGGQLLVKIRVYLNGKEVVRILRSNDRSQVWLANKIGVKQAYVSQMINGKVGVGSRLAPKILQTLRGHGWDTLFKMTMPSLTVS